MTNAAGGTIQALNIDSGQLSQPIQAGAAPGALVFDGVRIWVANQRDGTLQVVDPTAGDVDLPLDVGRRPTAVGVFAGQVWVANYADGTSAAAASWRN